MTSSASPYSLADKELSPLENGRKTVFRSPSRIVAPITAIQGRKHEGWYKIGVIFGDVCSTRWFEGCDDLPEGGDCNVRTLQLGQAF